MKSNSTLFSFCLLLTVLLLSSSLQADFTIDVHINGALNPTLTFGEVESSVATRSLPHPPFSGMFGVVDVCFAGDKDAPQWYDRLAEDIKTENTDNQWILIAKSNARITWKLKEGGIPEDLKIVWYDAKTKTNKWEKIKNKETLSLKTGTAYTIREIAEGESLEPVANPDKSTGYAKKVDGEITPIVFDLGVPTGQLDNLELRFYFNAGIGEIKFFEEPGKEGALWEVKFNAPGYTPAYRWDENDPNTLIITLTANGEGTRGEDNCEILLTAQKTSVPDLSISETSDIFNDIADTLYAIVLRYGTLDFDDNKKIDMNDVMYFYNFYNAGSPEYSDDEIEENENIRTLLDFTAKNPDNEDDFADAKTAIEKLRDYKDSLIFDGSQFLRIEQVMYLYNFYNAGSPGYSDDEIEENENIRTLLDFTTKNPDNEEHFNAAKTAMDTLRDYKDDL